MRKNRFFTYVVLCAGFLPIAYGQLCESTADPNKHTIYEWITRVQIGDVSHNSGQSFYSNFITDAEGNERPLFALTAAQTYDVEIDVAVQHGAWGEKIRVWFDLNQDNTLSHPQELVFSAEGKVTSKKTFYGSLTVPSCARNGETYMRVILVYTNTPTLCGVYQYGETEDYLVEISTQNTRPTSSDTRGSFTEDTPKSFAPSDFPFLGASDEHSLDVIYINVVFTQGTLTWPGHTVAAAISVPINEIQNIIYTPKQHVNGEGVDSFTFYVIDCRGIRSQASYRFFLDGDPVDDPATLNPGQGYAPEFAAPGTEIEYLPAQDVDDDSFSFRIIAGNIGDAFAVNVDRQAVVVQNSEPINYNLRQSFTLLIEVTSHPSNAVRLTTFTVWVNDVEHPTLVELADFYIREFAAIGTKVGTVIATDKDEDELYYDIVPDDAFEIDPMTGDIFIKNNLLLSTELYSTLTPEVHIYKLQDGDVTDLSEQVATTMPSVHILRPTWTGIGTYHADTSNWNIMDVPINTYERIIVESGTLRVESNVNIHAVEMRNDAHLLVTAGDAFHFMDYLHIRGLLQAAQGALISISGRMTDTGGTVLSNTNGNVLSMEGMYIDFPTTSFP